MVRSADGKKYAASTFQKAEPKIKQIHLQSIKIELQNEFLPRVPAEGIVPN